MTDFSYFDASTLSLQGTGERSYLIEANATTLPLYFALKGRHEYNVQGRERFVSAVAQAVAKAVRTVDLVVIPQSRSSFLREVMQQVQALSWVGFVELQKTAKDQVCAYASAAAGWRKLELASQQRAWDEMQEGFVINLVKANQRKHYIPFMFQPQALVASERVLLLDDFAMSGVTLAAMRHAIGRPDAPALTVFAETNRDLQA